MQDVMHLLKPHASELFEVQGSPARRALLLCPPLEALYENFNGGYFWGRALLIRPMIGGAGLPLPVGDWSESGLWAGLYDGACRGVIFFAEDAFGVQFGIREGRVVQFDPETAQISDCAETVREWAALLVGDPAYYTGAPVLAAWEAKNSAIGAGHRLVPKQLFMLGGAFHSENMACKADVEGMRIRAQLWSMTKDISDGQQVVLKGAK